MFIFRFIDAAWAAAAAMIVRAPSSVNRTWLRITRAFPLAVPVAPPG